MRLLAALLSAASILAPVPAPATHAAYATGHIAAGGPWSGFRSTSVAADRDSVDGFFFPAPAAGTMLRVQVVRNGGCASGQCLGYRLSVNFHTDQNLVETPGEAPDLGPRRFLANCTGQPSSSVLCAVPAGAATGEVAALSGVDLDVRVSIVHPVRKPKPARRSR